MSPRKQSLGYEAVLKALKAHSNFVPVDDDEIAVAFKAVDKETDRGAVILMATRLEDELTDYFKEMMEHLNSDERARIFGWEGPLGTFSAKARLAHALGHLDRHTFKMVEVVREMRNACAHSRQDISFDDAVMRNGVLLLAQMSNAEFDEHNSAKLYRMYFLMVTSWIRTTLGTNEEFAVFIHRTLINEAGAQTSEQTHLEQSSPSNPENQTGA